MSNKIIKNFILISLILILVEIQGFFSDQAVVGTRNIEVFTNKTSLTCQKYASQVLCKVGTNIPKNATYEIDKIIINGTLTQKQLENADVIIISRSRVIERLPQKLGNYFTELQGLLANLIGLRVVENSDFSNMTRLKTLNLADNKIESLPYNVFYNLTSLEILFLDNNTIHKIFPSVLSKCPKLTFFSVQFNQMNEVDDLFLENFNLQTALFGNNNISNINLTFSNHTKLINVDFRKNSQICKKCSDLLSRELRRKRERTCSATKYQDAKRYQEVFQTCIFDVTKRNKTILPEFNNCTTNLKTNEKEITKTFENCVDHSNGLSTFDDKQKQFSSCLYIRLDDGNKMRENFEKCIEVIEANNESFKTLVSECITIKNKAKENVREEYERCTFCKVDLDPTELAKCSMQYTGGDLDKFKRELNHFFPHTDL
ncbi:hypothetical protein PVAND_017715 [Polypedilum vanderplanki]|uniref:Uncharacterized protein n=1 Tax=Polypedilum vanderplanki TaxID=319348 RepID=A0A9J6B8F0_POLVA|nr:hypothetical protein PVAND_017715 [Polypedilum vanderplanki]